MRIKLEAISFCLNIDRASRGNIAVVHQRSHPNHFDLCYFLLKKKRGKSCFKLISRKRRSRRKKNKHVHQPFQRGCTTSSQTKINGRVPRGWQRANGRSRESRRLRSVGCFQLVQQVRVLWGGRERGRESVRGRGICL